MRRTIQSATLAWWWQYSIPKPGEISLAHRGVLFSDVLPEFGTRVLEVMRQPMEDKVVTISHAKGSLTFSANFQLVASMNPCPCGWLNDPQKACGCAPGVVTKYQKRISGPILDRIDIHIEVPRVDYEKLSGDRIGETLNLSELACKQQEIYKRSVSQKTVHPI